MKFSDGTELTDDQAESLERISEMASELIARQADATYASDEYSPEAHIDGLEYDMTRSAEDYVEAEITRQKATRDADD